MLSVGEWILESMTVSRHVSSVLINYLTNCAILPFVWIWK